jgi:CheY-like chemotaxis protein
MTVINQQAMHASNLIQQILDFSRRTTLEQQPVDLFPLFKEQIKLLERTLPEHINIDLNYGLDATSFTVSADLTRLQQVVMNLAVNARDAMPEGGELHIDLDRVWVENRKRAPLPEMEAGEWVKVMVSDTGTGIPSDVLPHIFEPFFTTKSAGAGTGLGLAQVWGIVNQHGGHIDVTTQIGEGTTFTLYLPALEPSRPEALARETSALSRGRGETILVVEDNAAVREAIVGSLGLLNYRTLAAADGAEALDAFEQHAGEIALVVSDTVMPAKGGVALMHALRGKGWTEPIVMMSGHPFRDGDDLTSQGVVARLQKPVSLEQLAQVVAQALRSF